MSQRLCASADGRWLAFVDGPSLVLYDLPGRREAARGTLPAAELVELGFTAHALLVHRRSAQGSEVEALRPPGLTSLGSIGLMHARLVLTFEEGAVLFPDDPEARPIHVLVTEQGLGHRHWLPNGRPAVLATVPGENALLVAAGDQLSTVEASTGRPLSPIPLKGLRGPIQAAGFCLGGRRIGGRSLWVASRAGVVDVFRLSDRLPMQRLELGRGELELAGNPEGAWLAALGGEPAGPPRLRLFEIGAMAPISLDGAGAVRALCVVGGADPLLITDEGEAGLQLRRLADEHLAKEALVATGRVVAQAQAAAAGGSAFVMPVPAERTSEPEGRAARPAPAGPVPALAEPLSGERPRAATVGRDAGSASNPRAAAAANEGPVSRARLLLEAAIARRGQAGMLTEGDDLPGFVSARQVVHMQRAPASTVAPAAPFDYTGTPIGRLGQALGLSPTQLDLLAVLLVCETDPVAARFASFLSGNQTQFALTLDLLLEIVYGAALAEPSVRAALLHEDLLPQHPLRRFKMVQLEGGDAKATLAHTLRLHPRLSGWLLGLTEIDGELQTWAEWYPPEAPPAGFDESLEAVALHALAQPGRFLLVEGQVRSGRRLLLRRVAHRLGRPLLVASTRAFFGPLGGERLLTLFREALLQGALVALDVEDDLAAELAQPLSECLAAFEGSVALLSTEGRRLAVGRLRPVVTVKVPIPPYEERLRLWREHLGPAARLSEQQWNEVAGLYNLGLGGIVRAGDLARDLAAVHGRAVVRDDVKMAVRQLFDADLSQVGRRAEVLQSWNDMVLSDEVGQGIADLLDRVQLRSDVFGSWGFARKLGKGLGLTVLFSGEPGTGKSMAAGLIAKQVGLDLYVVNLAQITSKWLGETEKNLGQAFDAAEAGHVVLLFDEADTVLGKRTAEVKSSNDRYANQETNFVLGRLEQFQGIAIFTTNLASAIDPAVMRRMSAHIRFPFPDEEARAELWRRVIPAETPVDGELDFAALARKYELSGGYIRNIVLRAAFRARREGVPLTTQLIEQAARSEYLERGKLTVGGRLE